MDDLEKAVLISFDESGTIDADLKSRAVAFCQQLKESPSICNLSIERLCFCKLVQVQFWCLQCLQDVVRGRYPSLGSEEKSQIRNLMLSIACSEGHLNNNSTHILESPAFIKNKLAQVLVTLIYFEYPLIWPSIFTDFLSHLSKGEVVIDMFCRVLNALDDEIISLDYPRTSEELAVASRVKDAMRHQCVNQIVRAWFEIVSAYINSDHELCVTVLGTMKRYISWIDIGLIVNDAFTPLLFDIILRDDLSEQLRVSAAGCISSVISKGMDAQNKLSLLQSLEISQIFGLVSGDNDSEFVSKIAALLTGYATEVLECFKRCTSELSTKLLNEILPSVFYVLRNCEVDTAFNTVQFFSSYVATMKGVSSLGEKQLLHLAQILEVIHKQVIYDPIYRNNIDVLDNIGKEEEDRMVEFRKDLFVLLRSVGRVAPDISYEFVKKLLTDVIASNSDSIVEEAEASMSIFYALGESISDRASGSVLLKELLPMLLSTRFSCHSNRILGLVYLETITRYSKLVQENTENIPLVLAAFLDERGIHNPNAIVSRRASYLFLRVVKLLKARLVPFIETILQSFQGIVAQFGRLNHTDLELSGVEDGSYVFESIGLLIGMDEVPPDKQSIYLSSLLTPLCQQVEDLLINAKVQDEDVSPVKISNIQQIITAINALSKGFNHRLVVTTRPAIGQMFKQTLDVLLQILVALPKIAPLRSKVTSFIHRMVDMLGESVLPYLSHALEQLLVETESKELVGFLILTNQLICKFGTVFHDILEGIFPSLANRILIILPKDWVPSGPVSNTEEIRELIELQKMFYTFLHLMTTHDLSSVLLSPTTLVYLYPLMQLLSYTACNHKDILIRKTCVQIFIQLIRDWCTGPSAEEKVPGFKIFVIEAFAFNCCLYSVLDNSFEFRDANTLILFGEIMLAQKVMYEEFGDEFLVQFISRGFPNVRCPQDLVEQYCQKLRGSDLKALKSIYQSLIENLRSQRNGSLVFR